MLFSFTSRKYGEAIPDLEKSLEVDPDFTKVCRSFSSILNRSLFKSNCLGATSLSTFQDEHWSILLVYWTDIKCLYGSNSFPRRCWLSPQLIFHHFIPHVWWLGDCQGAADLYQRILKAKPTDKQALKWVWAYTWLHMCFSTYGCLCRPLCLLHWLLYQ